MELFGMKPVYVKGGQTDGRVKVNKEELASINLPKDDLYEKVQLWNALPQVDYSVERSKIPPHNPTLEQSFHFDQYYKKDQSGLVPKLPIASFRNKIVDTINSWQVTVITGSTGCGKSTQVPQYIMDYHASNHYHCNMIVLQPRRVSAVSVAERVCMEKGWPVGSLCGYKIGLADKMSEDTRLLYVTTGIFLQMLLHDKSVNRFTHIFFDEIHEREKEMDFSLVVVKKYLATNSPNTKLILMSATAESDKFANFFSTKVDGIDIPAPLIEVDTSPLHEVKDFYLDDLKPLGRLPNFDVDNPTVMTECLQFGIQLLAQFDLLDYNLEQKSAVLIFLPGLGDIEEMYKLMSKQLNSGCGQSYKWQIIVLHSSIPPVEQQKAFSPVLPGYRKIILSTNIAESSITISDVSIVIDYCLTKVVMANCKNNTTKLISLWASKANLTQRYGRVGRVRKGLVYRMIPKATMETDLVNYNPPDMKRCLLEKVALQTIYLGMGDPVKFLSEALDPPDEDDVKKTILNLKETGAIPLRASDPYTPDCLTLLGRLMAVMPLDIRFTRLITLGYMFSVFKESIIIAACMTNKNVVVNPFFDKAMAYQMRLTWANGSQSDCISFLNIYETWKRHLTTGYFRRTRQNTEKDWAFKYNLRLKALYEVDKLVVELTDRFKKYGIEEVEGTQKIVWTDTEREFVLKVVLAGAFYPNYFRRPVDLSSTFEERATKMISGEDPFTTVYFKNFPDDLSLTHCEDQIREYMSECGESFEIFGDCDESPLIKFPKDTEPEINPDVPFDPRIPGGISLGVYRACRMKFSRNKLELFVLNPIEVRRKEIQLMSKQRRQKLQEEYDCISRNEKINCYGPPTDERCFPVKISHVANPGRFWCVALDDKAKEYNNELNKQLDSVRKHLQPFSKRPEVEQLCVVKTDNEENVLYRGRIVRVNGKHYKFWGAMVYLLDTGETKFFDKNNIMKYNICLWNDTKEIPCLAFECTLTKVRASPYLSPSGKWSPEATNEFKKITNEGNLSVEKYSVVSGVTSVFLMKWLPEKNNNLCINEYMVNMDYGMDCSESWKSEEYYRISNGERFTNGRDEYELIKLLRPPSNFSYQSPIKLSSPLSPLPLNLYCYTESKKNYHVNSSPNSVNAILLNPYGRDPFEQLMAAGTVSDGKYGEVLNLDETTMMPNIPGWASLIPLIFTPAAEIRTNQEGTAYAGAICGLGVDENGYAVHPDNDMQLNFDTVFTEEDLIDINRIRFSASAMLISEFYDQNMCSLTDRLHFKRIVQECFRNLFLKKKTIKQPEGPEYSLNWNSRSKLKHWEQQFVEQFDGMLMYGAHRPRKLSKNERKEILDRLEFLHDLVDNRKEWWDVMECDICEEKFDTVEELGKHFSSTTHKEREDEIKKEIQ